jgi:hypothetical protein
MSEANRIPDDRHIATRRLLPILGCLALVGCAHQPPPSGLEAPGFWLGLLHGFLILFSLIGSLFTDVRIYAFPNSGGWYDFGFCLGALLFVGSGGGGGAAARWQAQQRALEGAGGDREQYR